MVNSFSRFLSDEVLSKVRELYLQALTDANADADPNEPPSPYGRIDVSGVSLERFWHCFGTERHKAPLDVIVALLQASGTNVLPIDTHRLDEARDPDALEHGFAGVSYAALGDRIDVTPLREDAEHQPAHLRGCGGERRQDRVRHDRRAGAQARGAHSRPARVRGRRRGRGRPPVDGLGTVADRAAAAVLQRRGRQGGRRRRCPLLRIMGSPISSRAGITDEFAFAEITSMGAPVVLDGGIGKVSDLDRAIDLGAGGALVNSVLFDDGRPPALVMEGFAAAARRAFSRIAAR